MTISSSERAKEILEVIKDNIEHEAFLVDLLDAELRAAYWKGRNSSFEEVLHLKDHPKLEYSDTFSLKLNWR